MTTSDPPIVLFCCDPDSRGRPEPAYQPEADAAAACGADVVLVDHDRWVRGDLGQATRAVRRFDARRVGVYRGWMVTPEQYAALYDTLAQRNLHLVNDPTAYRRCHHLPESYAAIEGSTPRSIWIPADEGFELDSLMARLRPFGDASLILKDYVKSVKHAWEEACFIPCASDRDHVARVVRNFLAWQGEDLNGGLVFREFVELVSLGAHPQSGMPLTEEYRVVVLRGEILSCFPYWDADDYAVSTPPPLTWLRSIATRVDSRFFTMDVARRTDGGWIVVELGDAQVAGFPDHVDAGALIRSLCERLGRP